MIRSKSDRVTTDCENIHFVFRRIILDGEKTDYVWCIAQGCKNTTLYKWRQGSGTGTLKSHQCYVKATLERRRSRSVDEVFEGNDLDIDDAGSVASALSNATSETNQSLDSNLLFNIKWSKQEENIMANTMVEFVVDKVRPVLSCEDHYPRKACYESYLMGVRRRKAVSFDIFKNVMPGRSKVTKLIYERAAESQRNICFGNESAVLLDHWKSPGGSELLAMQTPYLIMKDPINPAIRISTFAIKEVDTTKGLETRQHIFDAVKNYDVDPNSVRFVSDRASSMLLAFENNEHIKCANHRLHNIITHGMTLEPMLTLHDTCRGLVEHAKRTRINKELKDAG